MDVVKTNVENIKGVIELSSEIDKGTTFRIKIPLTLAILPGLIVKSAGSRFIIPQTNLVEMIRHHNVDPMHVFEKVHDVLVYRLRNELLKVVHLTDVLGLSEEDTESAKEKTFNIIVIKAND